MALPTFRSLAVRRQERDAAARSSSSDTAADTTLPHEQQTAANETEKGAYTPAVNLKLATKTRRNWIYLSSLLYFLSVVFLILTEIGNINNKPVIRNTWFFKLSLANIIPASIPSEIAFTNSLARSLGLHDFYQIGLWNFCEGYVDSGITYCSPNTSLYWFNPVEILLNELLAGATIALPADINKILTLIKIASHIMWGFFLVGTCMNFISIFLAPLVLYSRWRSLPFAIWTFIGALLTVAAAVIATVMFIIFRNVITSQEGLNIGASVGVQMFAFMWVGAAGSFLGWLIHTGLGCCCASTRDVKNGRRKGRKSAYGEMAGQEKKKRTLPMFRRRKNAGETV